MNSKLKNRESKIIYVIISSCPGVTNTVTKSRQTKDKYREVILKKCAKIGGLGF